VVIIHPYAQAYRRGLYSRLDERLREVGRELVVVANEPPPRVAQRGDAITASWTKDVECRWLSLGGKYVGYRFLGDLRLDRNDLVIVEQAVKNLETYSLLAANRRGGPGVAMWGHGRSYSEPQGAVLASAKQWLTRRMEWFFAYTDAGAQHVCERGFARERVTVLRNTIDTEDLRARVQAVSDVASYVDELGLTPGRTALFLGGVDESKGIDFLLDSTRLIADRMPEFTMLVGGTGRALPRVQAVARSGVRVRALGRLDDDAKAKALAACDILTIPQWIGLVAVDSLVAGRPIVSTLHHSHSPEREYLHSGRTAVFSDHHPTRYADAVIELLEDRPRLARMQQACAEDAAQYSVEGMVESFVAGIRSWGAQRG
jgi:glycosyltransferase involved in cell wall biosynthesis